MKFSKLLPELHGSADFKPEAPRWQLSFCCPLCQHRTGILVSGNPPAGFVWKLAPDPLAILNSIQSGELIEPQWAKIWDGVTIEPSMQQLPHPRQVTCAAHFSVTKGEIVLS